MAGRLQLEIVTHERRVLAAAVDEVIARGASGEFGVLPGHTHFVTTLLPGVLRYRDGDRWFDLAVAGGIARVLDDKVLILAKAAERPDEIDVERAERSAQRARARLAQLSYYDKDADKMLLRLQRALIRLQLASRKK